MSSVILTRILPNIRLLCQVRSAGHWNKDWMPGPYPETKEQRDAAAKKYNLLPEEYEPFPEGTSIHSYGDYPKLPDISAVNKDIYYPWDYVRERKNYGEPMHNRSIYYIEDRVDSLLDKKLRYSKIVMFLWIVGGVSFIAVLPFLPIQIFLPVTARQMPKEGVIHYSYDPVD
ncbi:NADH:ubiquinone oxidoreductase subunit ASHI [Lycorma delicatula]|uniref:NADH:ubiquinone oxidoreductase subunit ASHI n=1 Tax=Lycorma delicatula TaxID=130591 RepID=UPI003F50F41F